MSFRPQSCPTLQWITCAILLAAAMPGAVQAQANAEHAAVREVIETYFRGHAQADAASMRAAFLPTAHVEGIRNGSLHSWTARAYAGNFNGQPAPDEAARRRVIDLIDVTGTAAMVKATLIQGATTFTDYFVLLKVDGAWKIANKVYHAERRTP